MPFADYEGMDDCKRAHSDKDDPGAYCAQIHKDATGEWPSEKAGSGSIAGRAVELLSSVLPGESGGGDTALKVYVPDPSCVPPGPETQRDDGGWFYTETPEGLRERGAPEGFVEVVPADEVLYPSVKRAAGVGSGATGKGPWVPYAGPDGGRGWQDANNPDDVRYTDDPPGEPVNPDDIPPVEFARVAEGLGDDIDGRDVKDMLWEEYHDYTPDFGEGDTVAVETDEGRFEGEVTFYDGDFVDVETEDGRTVEAEAGDVLDVPEKDTPDAPWGGTKNRGAVDDDVTKEDIVEAIENTDALSEERKQQTIEEFERTLSPDGDWRDANDSVRDALDYAVVRPSKTGLTRNAAVHRITREAKRGETFSDNSAPDHLDPTRAEEVETLGEAADVGTGITAEAMDVCEMPDGGRLFVTHTDSTLPRQTSGTPQASGKDAVAAVDAANALEAMGFPAPDHHYEHNRFLAVEEVDGEPITDRITDDFDAPPDQRQVERCMAAQILVGNRDPHSGNVMMVTEEEDAGAGMGTVEQSKAVCFDLDLSGLDLTPGGSSGQTARYAIEKATKTVDKATGTGLMSTMDDEEMAKRVRDLARMVSIDDIRSAVKDEDMEETMIANIEAWRDYEEGDLY